MTIAKRPSVWDGMARGCRDDLPDEQNGIFLQEGLDKFLLICPSGNFSSRFVAQVSRLVRA
jgi:hypothetical protein